MKWLPITSLNVFLVIVSVTIGIVVGTVVPIRVFGQIPGFQTGIAFGGPVIVLGSLMAGAVAGGRLEEVLGTEIGVPVGLFVGCLLGGMLLALISGTVGALLSHLMAR